MKKAIVLISIIITLILGLHFSGMFTILGGGTISNFIQYDGMPTSGGSYLSWWDNSIKSSNIVILSNYKFVTQKYNRYATVTCKYCTGIATGIFDEYGCEIYNQTVPIYSKQYVREVCYTSGGCKGMDTYNVQLWTGHNYYTGHSVCLDNKPEDVHSPYGYYYSYCKTIQTGTQLVDCKGVNTVLNWGPSYTIDIYKDNLLIESKGHVFSESASDLTNVYRYEDEEIRIVIKDSYWYEYYVFKSMQNQYTLKLPENAFEFEVSMPKTSIFLKGQPAIIDVSVKNLYLDNIIVDITTTVCQPTWHGDFCHDLTKQESLPLGETIIQFEIPTHFVTEKLEATPKITVYFDMNKMALSGININPNIVIMDLDTMTTCSQHLSGRTTITDVGLCKGYIPLGSVSGDTKTIQVAPKPLYTDMVGGICVDSDYEPSYNNAYCVLKEVKDLTCVHLGCPTVEGHEYACTSAGICAETVFVTVWGTCPEGTTPTTTTEGEKICIKTEIAEVILQCDMNTIPPAICEGITAVCVDNLWVFEGKCIAKPDIPSSLSLWDKFKLKWDTFWLTIMDKLGY